MVVLDPLIDACLQLACSSLTLWPKGSQSVIRIYGPTNNRDNDDRTGKQAFRSPTAFLGAI